MEKNKINREASSPDCMSVIISHNHFNSDEDTDSYIEAYLVWDGAIGYCRGGNKMEKGDTVRVEVCRTSLEGVVLLSAESFYQEFVKPLREKNGTLGRKGLNTLAEHVITDLLFILEGDVDMYKDEKVLAFN